MTIKDMMRKLENMKREIEVSSHSTVSIFPDEKGMIDKQCPKPECDRLFKVNKVDWKNIFIDNHVFCPFCRNDSPAGEYTPGTLKKTVAENFRQGILNHWHRGSPILQEMYPLPSLTAYDVAIHCSDCNVRYAVIGSAFFCPNCGINNIKATGIELVEKVKLMIMNSEALQSFIETNTSKDDAVNYLRWLQEKALTDCVGILQNFCELLYNQRSLIPAPFNTFQRIQEGNNLWITLAGKGYVDWLTPLEFEEQKTMTQQRHLLEHKGGIIDQRYIDRTRDIRYLVGERLIVSKHAVLQLCDIVMKIMTGILAS